MRVLLAYATRYGSTREVADAVATSLREGGLEVEQLPMSEVSTLDGHAAVVLGMPLYMGHWVEDAARFLTRQREALVRRPVAVFTLGPTRGDEKERASVQEQFEEELDVYPWLSPVASALFGGRYDPATLDASHKLLAVLPGSPLHGVPASDVRDWPAIRSWAVELAAKLRRIDEL